MTERMGEWTAPAPTRASAAVVNAVTQGNLDAAMQGAVRRALRQRLDAIASKALDEALKDEMLAELVQSAAAAARSSLLEPAVDAPAEHEPPALYYPTVLEFVTGFLLPVYRRPATGQGSTWCPQWWRHAEANARLTALWRAWEHLRLDAGTGSSVWFRDHADHHMAVLLSADGPFKGCKPEGHADRLQPLPSTPPPDGLFRIDGQTGEGDADA